MSQRCQHCLTDAAMRPGESLCAWCQLDTVKSDLADMTEEYNVACNRLHDLESEFASMQDQLELSNDSWCSSCNSASRSYGIDT